MKKHFINLFSNVNRKKTIMFFIIAVVLFAAAMIVTISDNAPGIILLYASIVFFYLAFIHTWRKPSHYLIMSGVCGGVIALVFLGLNIWTKFFLTSGVPNQPTQGEGIAEAIIFFLVLFLSLTGIAVGLLGAIISTFLNKEE